jgi:hypothetical protein
MKSKSTAEKSDIQVYTHNTKITPVDGWTTTSKRGTIVIEDKKHGYLFCIQLGRKPKIGAYDIKNNGDIIGNQLLDVTVHSGVNDPWNKNKSSKS